MYLPPLTRTIRYGPDRYNHLLTYLLTFLSSRVLILCLSCNVVCYMIFILSCLFLIPIVHILLSLVSLVSYYHFPLVNAHVFVFLLYAIKGSYLSVLYSTIYNLSHL